MAPSSGWLATRASASFWRATGSSTSFTIPRASTRALMIFEKGKRSPSTWARGRKGRGARTSGSPERLRCAAPDDADRVFVEGDHHEWKSAPQRNPPTSAPQTEARQAARAAGGGTGGWARRDRSEAAENIRARLRAAAVQVECRRGRDGSC